MCVEVLWPHGKPPWVGRLLLVENIESMCAGAKDSDAENYDETRKNGLRKMKGCRVDLHVGSSTAVFSAVLRVVKAEALICMAMPNSEALGIARVGVPDLQNKITT